MADNVREVTSGDATPQPKALTLIPIPDKNSGTTPAR
jgi:hypothetical protein